MSPAAVGCKPMSSGAGLLGALFQDLDPRPTPEGIRGRVGSGCERLDGPPARALPALPGPEQINATTVPVDDGLRLEVRPSRLPVNSADDSQYDYRRAASFRLV
jgi:hypothetical protein